MSDKKKLSEMTLEEQVAYYQKKTAEVKAKMVKKANERYLLIGKIVSEIFDDMPTADNKLQAYFTKVAEAYQSKNENAKVTPSQDAGNSVGTQYGNSVGGQNANLPQNNGYSNRQRREKVGWFC